jgi:hypothetical protein
MEVDQTPAVLESETAAETRTESASHPSNAQSEAVYEKEVLTP